MDFLSIGDRASGTPVDIGQWTGNLPNYIRGATIETGTVIATNLQRKEVVRIRTENGREYWIRRALRVIDRRPNPGQRRTYY